MTKEDYKFGFNYLMEKSFLFGNVSKERLERAFLVEMEKWKREILEKNRKLKFEE